MKKVFERTEEVIAFNKYMKESTKEDADYSKQLLEKYPELKPLYDMKPSLVVEDALGLGSPDKDSVASPLHTSDLN